jgi:anti-sigma B factor antagonist
MKLNLYNKNDAVVLELVGKVMAGKSVVLLDEKLYSLLGRGKKKVVIDLSKTAWLSSCAISTLLNHNVMFKEAGGVLKLANLTDKIEEIITVTRLTSFFEVYDSLDAALGSFIEKVENRTVSETLL